MDTETFVRKKMLELHDNLRAVEEDRANGSKGYTIDELDAILEKIVSANEE